MKKRLIILPVALFVVLTSVVYAVTAYKFKNQIAAKVSDYSGEIKLADKLGYYHGQEVSVPGELFDNSPIRVLGLANDSSKRIEVDLSEQRVYAWEGDKLFLTSLVSTGLPWWPTPTGEFEIWIKLRATRMEGGEGKYYYNLPNVPYTMFYYNNDVPKWRGYSLHGAYWHNDFGSPHSHGCVNLPVEVAKDLYYWANPVLSPGQNIVYSSPENVGTKVTIHE